MLLIILIVLAVFTLWLYQRNITSGSPDLTPAVEQTESTSKHTFLKQKPKVDKPAVVEEEEGPVFFDEKPEQVKEIEEKEPEVAKEPSAPRVIDDVPARMMTSGQEEEIEEKNISEEDVLAKKPAFKPGAKYDEMFVAEDDFVEEVQTPELFIEDPVAGQQIEIEPEFVQEDEVPAEYAGENPFYDEEEAEYQLEQAEMYYEE